MTEDSGSFPAPTNADAFSVSDGEILRLKKMAAIATLSRVVAHEFNNVMASVVGYAELSMLEVPEDSEAHQHLQAMVSVYGRAKTLIDQLRILSLRSFHEPRPLDIREIAEEAVNEAKERLPESIRVRCDLKSGCRKVMADIEQVKQIFEHLIDNARRAMEEAGGTLAVTVDERELTAADVADPDAAPGPFVHFAVADTGRGIEQKLVEQMFDPFVTTREEEKRAGIGLSIVHCFVKQHRGVVKVSTAPGKGSVFHVFLPAGGTEDEKAAKPR